ncbi:MAG: restriction endonuclease [Acidimicrobiales bacterium]
MDILDMDWPSVRAEVDTCLYDDLEPLPVNVDDLGELANARPQGPVSTALDWDSLTAQEFERLVFELVHQADGYENANWLMHTNAPDRGRDIEVFRVVNDALGGTLRTRVIIQCKHWRSRPVGGSDLVQCAELVTLWEPPVVDVLIVATSGRFSSDAVGLIEKRRQERKLPIIEPWPDSHLESLISRRPGIAARFGLR